MVRYVKLFWGDKQKQNKESRLYGCNKQTDSGKPWRGAGKVRDSPPGIADTVSKHLSPGFLCRCQAGNLL